MDNILDVCQISVEQGDFSLKDISFSVKKGYITGLIGRNGSGKTTLINAICNAVELKSGTIKMLGRDSVEEEVLNKQELGIVMEELSYFGKNFSIWENAKMLAPLYRDWDDEILEYYLKKYGIITGKETNFQKYGDAKRPIMAYSKGEQVKIRLALALAHKPRLLLLDEPTANLDPVFRREFLEDLQELIDCPFWLRGETESEREQQGMGVVLCTHITSELDQIGDYILLLENGALLADGERDELFAKHQVRDTKELILKLTGREEGFVFHDQELHGKRVRLKQPERGKARFRLDKYAVPSNNVDGLRQCEEYIYKHAIAGKIFSGWTFVLYLFLAGMGIFLYMLHLDYGNNIIGGIACVLIAIINMQYFSHYTENWDDELKEAVPYLPFNIGDMKICLKEQRKRLLLFWLVVQSVLALLVGFFGIIKEGKLPLEWMAGLVLEGIVITLYSGHCWMRRLKNQKKYLYKELAILCAALLLILVFL